MLEKIKGLLFRNTTTKQTIAKNVFWLGVSNAGGRLLRTIVIIYAARVLGAGSWGLFSYAVTLAGFATTIVDLGLGPYLTRERSKEQLPEARAKILSTAFYIKTTLLVVAMVGIIFLGPHLTSIKEVNMLLPIAALVLAFDALREFCFAYMRALERMEWEAGIFLLTNLAIVGFGLVALTIRPTVRTFTLSYAVGTAVGMIAAFIVLRGHLSELLSKFSFRLVRKVLSQSAPFAISLVLGSIMINTDVLMIGYFGSAQDVGFYSAAQRLIQFLYLVPGIVATGSFPLLSRLAAVTEGQKEKMGSILSYLIGFTLLAAFPISIGGYLVANKLIPALFGASYSPAVWSCKILLLTLIVNFPSVMLSNAVFATGRNKTLVIYAGLGAVLNFLLDLAFIPRYGIVGSSWATLISQTITTTYIWHKTRAFSSLRVFPKLKRVFAATFVMTLCTVLLISANAGLAITIVIAAVVYLGILYALKEPMLKELQKLVRLREA